MTWSGGCLCGAVRYEIDGDPKFVTNCYCTDCQKESGAGHLTLAAFADAGLRLTGETRSYVSTADSGNTVPRTFCPVCGTTLIGRPGGLKGLSMVRAGTLDDSAGLTTSIAIYGDSARDWDQPPAGVKLFPAMPPQR
jgi:hypothetical protein